MSQQPLFVPAAAGWYPCPGDPPGVTRHWDGKMWLCEIHGPIRDHFDHLRALSVQGLSPEDLAVLKQLTNEVSRIEDLALAGPTLNPPLVQIAAPPPYVPPPVDPYTSAPIPAHGMAGSSPSAGNGQRFAAPGRNAGGKGLGGLLRGRNKILVAVIAVVAVAVLIGGGLVVGQMSGMFASAPASLTVNSCVTLSYPSGATDAQDITWTKGDCTTPSGGPVSYTVIAKLAGNAACDENSQYVQTLNGNKSVANTYCLMENLTAGECLYEDHQGFYFDVACTDVRAVIKVSASVNQGSNFTCPDGSTAWTFPSASRTYCLTKP